MFSATSFMSSTARVLSIASTVYNASFLQNVALAHLELEDEMIPSFFVWHYNVEPNRQLYLWRFWCMRFNFDRFQEDNAPVSWDNFAHLWLETWEHFDFRFAYFLRMTDLTADTPFVPCSKHRRYVERLLTFIGEVINDGDFPRPSLTLYLISHSIHLFVVHW